MYELIVQVTPTVMLESIEWKQEKKMLRHQISDIARAFFVILQHRTIAKRQNEISSVTVMGSDACVSERDIFRSCSFYFVTQQTARKRSNMYNCTFFFVVVVRWRRRRRTKNILHSIFFCSFASFAHFVFIFCLAGAAAAEKNPIHETFARQMINDNNCVHRQQAHPILNLNFMEFK